MALGMAASRFLKASSVERYEASADQRPPTPARLPATTTYAAPAPATTPDGQPAGTGAL
jgi:hypothetical protein